MVDCTFSSGYKSEFLQLCSSGLMSLLADDALTFYLVTFPVQTGHIHQLDVVCILPVSLKSHNSNSSSHLWGSKDRMWAEEFSIVLLNTNCCHIVGQVAYS